MVFAKESGLSSRDTGNCLFNACHVKIMSKVGSVLMSDDTEQGKKQTTCLRHLTVAPSALLPGTLDDVYGFVYIASDD